MGEIRMPVGDPDGELVRRAAEGDEAAFARLIRLHHETLTAVALVVTLDPVSAARSVRVAWPAAWAGLQKIAERGRFAPWVAGAVVDEAMGAADPDPSGARGGARSDDPAGIGARLAAIPRADRRLLSLHLLGGYGVAELAIRERRPAATVGGRITHLLDALGGPEPVLAWAVRPVRPVDIDGTARWARGEAELARSRPWSIAVSAAAALFIALFPLLARVLHGG